MYAIFDWAGNRINPNLSFETFEDGWEYIYDTFGEDDYQELFVLEDKSNE